MRGLHSKPEVVYFKFFFFAVPSSEATCHIFVDTDGDFGVK